MVKLSVVNALKGKKKNPDLSTRFSYNFHKSLHISSALMITNNINITTTITTINITITISITGSIASCYLSHLSTAHQFGSPIWFTLRCLHNHKSCCPSQMSRDEQMGSPHDQ
ncbi:hypothetical protein M8J75_013791 [Diaphorina citri]|nr:hypothetical protein M8J75_013791 [Diaphorina citri]KAI5715886.1 hypothetical protein M8J77_024106 [Diaphorina citri]